MRRHARLPLVSFTRTQMSDPAFHPMLVCSATACARLPGTATDAQVWRALADGQPATIEDLFAPDEILRARRLQRGCRIRVHTTVPTCRATICPASPRAPQPGGGDHVPVISAAAIRPTFGIRRWRRSPAIALHSTRGTRLWMGESSLPTCGSVTAGSPLGCTMTKSTTCSSKSVGSACCSCRPMLLRPSSSAPRAGVAPSMGAPGRRQRGVRPWIISSERVDAQAHTRPCQPERRCEALRVATSTSIPARCRTSSRRQVGWMPPRVAPDDDGPESCYSSEGHRRPPKISTWPPTPGTRATRNGERQRCARRLPVPYGRHVRVAEACDFSSKAWAVGNAPFSMDARLAGCCARLARRAGHHAGGVRRRYLAPRATTAPCRRGRATAEYTPAILPVPLLGLPCNPCLRRAAGPAAAEYGAATDEDGADLALLSAAIDELEPQTILELGTASGANAMWLADVARMRGLRVRIPLT